MPRHYGCHHQKCCWVADLPGGPPKEMQGQVLFAFQENYLKMMSSPLQPHQPAAPWSVEKRWGGRVRNPGCGARHHLLTLADCRFWGHPKLRQWWAFCSCGKCSTAVAEPTCRHAGVFSSPLLPGLPKVTAFGRVFVQVNNPCTWLFSALVRAPEGFGGAGAQPR